MFKIVTFAVASLLVIIIVVLSGAAQIAAIAALLFLGGIIWLVRKFRGDKEFGLDDQQTRGEREALRFLANRR